MPNLHIKDIDQRLYAELKRVAADENRSVSQQVLFMIRNYLAQWEEKRKTETAAQAFLDLAGSWGDSRSAEEIVGEVKGARRSSTKLSEGL